MGWGEGNDDLLFLLGDFSGLSQINKRRGANMGKMSLDSFVSKSTTRNMRK